MKTKTFHIVVAVIVVAAIAGLFVGTKKIEAPVTDGAATSTVGSMDGAATSTDSAATSTASTLPPAPNGGQPSAGTKANALAGTEWTWLYTKLGNGTTVNAPAGGKFVLGFGADLNARSSTDCNGLGGTYIIDGEVLSFGPFVSTMMFCEGSLEGQYAQQLALAGSYVITGNELKLNLNRDYGTMFFARKAKAN